VNGVDPSGNDGVIVGKLPQPTRQPINLGPPISIENPNPSPLPSPVGISIGKAPNPNPVSGLPGGSPPIWLQPIKLGPVSVGLGKNGAVIVYPIGKGISVGGVIVVPIGRNPGFGGLGVSASF